MTYLPELSIIVCVLNEEDSIQHFIDKVTPFVESCTDDYEILFVDDGSTDTTLQILKDLSEPAHSKVSVISLSRNFGKDKAMTAGLDCAHGKAVIPMDVDLQDPPELIPKMVELWREGADMVVGVRSDRQDDGWLKRKTANVFYRLIGMMSDIKIPSNAGDYRLIDRKVLRVIQNMREKTRFMKGIFSFPGFKVEFVSYRRPPRARGTSKWNYWKLWNFGLDGIFSFSTVPLRIWTYIGLLTALLSFTYLLVIVIKTLVLGRDMPGYASLISTVLFFNSITMIGIGTLGEYIGRIFNEVKQRPIYIIKESHGSIAEDLPKIY
jgi:glycosyltransferase involved in cell wall biosynthesis